jgi:protoporphyrin/coproporphyrin ferrochelatase
MGPSTSSTLEGFGKQGHKHVLAVPIAFTSDHIETLFEIDIEYAEEAHEHGITVRPNRESAAWRLEHSD